MMEEFDKKLLKQLYVPAHQVQKKVKMEKSYNWWF